MSRKYEVVIFTASLSKYAEPLVKVMDQAEKWCSHLLFREHCTYLEDHEAYVKDLSLIGRDLKDVIIIDNSPTSYFFHPENALASRSWYEDTDDSELYEFIPLLVELSKLDDVRPALKKISSNACYRVGKDIIVKVPTALTIVKDLEAK